MSTRIPTHRASRPLLQTVRDWAVVTNYGRVDLSVAIVDRMGALVGRAMASLILRAYPLAKAQIADINAASLAPRSTCAPMRTDSSPPSDCTRAISVARTRMRS